MFMPRSADTVAGMTDSAATVRSFRSATRMLTTSVALSGAAEVSVTMTVGVQSGWSSQSRFTAPETVMLPETASMAKGAAIALAASE